MSAIDNAHAALGNYESWDGGMPHIEELEGQIARDHADALAVQLRNLIAEHERLTASLTKDEGARLREATDRMSPLSDKPYSSLDLALVRDAAYRAAATASTPTDHTDGGS